MTYCNLETEQTKYFREEFSFEEIKKWFDDLMEEYGKWATFQCEMKNQRQASIKELDFHLSTDRGRKSLFRMSTGQLCVRSFFLCRLRPVWERLSLLFPGSEGGW